MVRKVILNLVLIVMAAASPLAQGLVVQIVLLSFIAAHVYFQPYEEDKLNRIELCSLVLAATVLQLGFFLFDDDMLVGLKSSITVLMVTLLIVSAGAFIVVLARQYRKSQSENIQGGVAKVREKAFAIESGIEMAIQRLRAKSHSKRSPSTDSAAEFEIENPFHE